VKDLVKVDLTQQQFDPLVDFVFALGEGRFAKSTLLKDINAGNCDAETIKRDFAMWNKITVTDKSTGEKVKKVSPRAAERRAINTETFNNGVYK
jgi:GH24 family phage-related lysozyme (muramidase)